MSDSERTLTLEPVCAPHMPCRPVHTYHHSAPPAPSADTPLRDPSAAAGGLRWPIVVRPTFLYDRVPKEFHVRMPKELQDKIPRMTTLNADSIKAKLERERANPQEAAKMDAEIRESKRSVGARAMVDAIKAAQARGLTKEAIEAELKEQKEAYPRLFAMVLDPKHSPAMLYAMLAQLESVEAGARSTHDASVAVGTILVNSFVRPKLGMEQVPLPGSASQPGRP